MLESSFEGLTEHEAKKRFKECSRREGKARKKAGRFYLFFSQFKSPLVLLLLLAAVLSFCLQEVINGSIILGMVALSGILGFYQEKGASDAFESLTETIAVKARVIRDKIETEIPREQVVPGDIAILGAGDIIPGDCLLLKSKDFFVNQSALTGETLGVEKKEGTASQDASLSERSNTLFMGSYVLSGSAEAVVVLTGKATEFGKMSHSLSEPTPATGFEMGVGHLAYFLLRVMLVLTLFIFLCNMCLGRPLWDSFLFTVALSVGLTPQLLPTLLAVNLSRGAKKMAGCKMIVKKLVSIADLGGMDILCVDKTGTLTKGEVAVHAAIDSKGKQNDLVLFYAFLNAHFQTGYANPIDHSIVQCSNFPLSSWEKLDEIPYDFSRRRLSVLVSQGNQRLMICKGALSSILEICSKGIGEDTQKIIKEWAEQGYRLLGVAYRSHDRKEINKDDEHNLIFLGFLVLHDPLKENIGATLSSMKEQGVVIKVITGDHSLVAQNVCRQIGINCSFLLTGKDLFELTDEEIVKKVKGVDLFTEMGPEQKKQIIKALRALGYVVGFLGDGINDVSALHAADIGISVDTASDVVRESADIVLLEKDLSVLHQGITEGRKTFANMLKYIFVATSANFGNMFSMAAASLFLPFFPLLPKQILLVNLLTDFPEMALSTDTVDAEMIAKPLKWDFAFIRRFMVFFGLISSFFDCLTFGFLIDILRN